MQSVRWLIAVGMINLAVPTQGQTIQLPSFSQFSVSTTVLVPDSGPSPYARDRRAATSAAHLRGIPGNRSIGDERQTMGASIVARIHDAEEADRALLAQQFAANRAATTSTAPSKVVRPSGVDAGLSSVASLQQQRAERQAAQDREALVLVDKARTAFAQGKAAVAANYFRAAAKSASPALKARIDAESLSLRRK